MLLISFAIYFCFLFLTRTNAILGNTELMEMLDMHISRLPEVTKEALSTYYNNREIFFPFTTRLLLIAVVTKLSETQVCWWHITDARIVKEARICLENGNLLRRIDLLKMNPVRISLPALKFFNDYCGLEVLFLGLEEKNMEIINNIDFGSVKVLVLECLDWRDFPLLTGFRHLKTLYLMACTNSTFPLSKYKTHSGYITMRTVRKLSFVQKGEVEKAVTQDIYKYLNIFPECTDFGSCSKEAMTKEIDAYLG